MMISLAGLQEGRKAKIVGIKGGYGFVRNLRARGIREGKIVEIVAKHPLGGPIVIAINGRETTLGRGMAEKIIVEEI